MRGSERAVAIPGPASTGNRQSLELGERDSGRGQRLLVHRTPSDESLVTKKTLERGLQTTAPSYRCYLRLVDR